MRFRNVRHIEPIPLQLAPMIDVLLLLLLFFIITLDMGRRETELTIMVPAADEGKDNENRQLGEIVVNVREDGSIVVEGETITLEQLLNKFQIIASVHKDQAVILRLDEKSTNNHTIDILNACHKAGIWNVSFATRPPEPDAAPPSS
ncbi:biopolymer transporter ExbD [Phragmitibacter flavus]|uniref:Biopolymer transporter ExbD n=1 Tax=Phragmitibacter flavus TaxID=2576071 RepID=A0A5R8KIE2_9BACT|nr:biopolymer transporter ExbD [Phragmitibacter flavus]TLD72086.1 biopolymer transporter ExbD [Phragmitibacter flavus]